MLKNTNCMLNIVLYRFKIICKNLRYISNTVYSSLKITTLSYYIKVKYCHFQFRSVGSNLPYTILNTGLYIQSHSSLRITLFFPFQESVFKGLCPFFPGISSSSLQDPIFSPRSLSSFLKTHFHHLLLMNLPFISLRLLPYYVL